MTYNIVCKHASGWGKVILEVFLSVMVNKNEHTLGVKENVANLLADSCISWHALTKQEVLMVKQTLVEKKIRAVLNLASYFVWRRCLHNDILLEEHWRKTIGHHLD